MSWGIQGRADGGDGALLHPAKEEGSTPHPLLVASSSTFNRGELAAFLSSAALLLGHLTPGN